MTYEAPDVTAVTEVAQPLIAIVSTLATNPQWAADDQDPS